MGQRSRYLDFSEKIHNFFFFNKDISLKPSNIEKQTIKEKQRNKQTEIILVFVENIFSSERIINARKNHNIFNSGLQYKGYVTLSYIVK